MSESTKRIIIGEAVAGAAWLIVMLVSESIFTNLAVFGISIMFGVLACVASVLSLLFNDRELRSAGVMTEVRSLPVVVSVGYFAAALIANTIFCFANWSVGGVRTPIIVNVILLAVMVIVRMGTDSYQKVAEENVEKVSANVADTTAIKSELSRLMALADDPSVKAELHQLKEDVDFSPSLAGPNAKAVERNFLAALDAVGASLARNEEPERTIGLVKKAESIWEALDASMSD